MRGHDDEQLAAVAWRERKAVVAHRGTRDGLHDTSDPSRSFVARELGYAVPYVPPTLRETCEALSWHSDSPRPPTQSAVAAGESLLSLVVEVEWCVMTIMLAHGLERSRP